jgi:hypothetical protein
MIDPHFTNPRLEMSSGDYSNYDKWLEEARGIWESSFDDGDYGYPEEEDDE